MSHVEKIGSQIAGFSSTELAAFRKWFFEFDASDRDRQFEADVTARRLDGLAENALRGHASGRSREL